MIKIVDDIKHVADLPSGEINRRGGSFCVNNGDDGGVCKEGLLARPLDGQQASIHIEAVVGIGEYA